MTQKPQPNQSDKLSRRDALAKLARLSAYTAPAVVTLLSAQTSHAQSSEAQMNLNNGQINSICMSLSNLPGELGNDTSGGFFGSNNTADCGM